MRQTETKGITLKNPTNQRWVVRSRLSGNDSRWWRPVSDVTIIEAQQSKQIDFIYHPMRMTTVGQKHDASVFLQLPDGNGQFFQLIGIAEAPKPIQIPLKEVAAKTTHVEKIPVANWMKKQQKFK